jgi:hypothetical protein
MIWLAGMPGARETRLTPSKETCRRARKPADEQGNLPTTKETCRRARKPADAQGNLPTSKETCPIVLKLLITVLASLIGVKIFNILINLLLLFPFKYRLKFLSSLKFANEIFVLLWNRFKTNK